MRNVFRNSWVGAAVLAALLGWSDAPARGQQPNQPAQPAQPSQSPKTSPEKKPSLEELLTQALRDNPDVRVAEAKLREAEAELNRTRLQVMQRLIAYHAELDAARRTAEEAEQRYQRVLKLGQNKAISQEEIRTAELTLMRYKAELAKAEAELPYLLGQPAFREKADTPEPRPARNRFVPFTLFRAVPLAEFQPSVVAGDRADRLRQALDTPVTIRADQATLSEVLRNLEPKVDGVKFVVHLEGRMAERPNPVTLDMQKVPLGAVLQALEDVSFGVAFLVRDYGILVIAREQVPDGAVSVRDFWKGGRKEPMALSSAAIPTNPLPEGVEGEVKAVDDQAGVVTISLGSDAGLTEGHTLEVFRLNPPKYLGTLRILKVAPKEAVAKPVSRTQAPLKAGDRVASRLLGR